MGKVAFVTGASTGIGREICLQLADEGYDIGLMARSKDVLEEVGKIIRGKGRKAVPVAGDVVDDEFLKSSVKKVEEVLGPIDLLVANAGIGEDQPIQRFKSDRARRIYEVNVIGFMQSVAAVLPQMVNRREGHIVGIASLASYISFPKTYVYCASKFAVRAHLEGLALEAADYNIAVTTVCPGFVRTPLTDKNKFKMPMLMEPEEAVRIIIKGIKKKKKVVNFPTTLYFLIRFANILPRFLKKLVL